MKRRIKHLCLFLTLIIISAALCPLHAGADADYTLFVNDEPWYTETLYGWQKINQVYYVPISVFLNIDGVSISTDDDKSVTTIKYGKKYIDIDITDKRFAYTKEYGEFYFKTYNLRSGLLFVPAITVCGYFGFQLDIYDGEKAIRICDGSQSLSFYELLLLYNTDIVLKRTEKTADPFETGTNTAYMCFDMEKDDGEGALRIAGLLSEYGGSGTFFMNKSAISGNMAAIRSILISGCEAGIVSDEDIDSAEALIMYADEANELLYACARIKTRIVWIPDSCAFVPDDKDIEKIKASGYMLWGYDLDAKEVQYKKAENAVRNFMNSASGRVSFSARFGCKDISVETLRTVLKYLTEKEGYSIMSPDGTRAYGAGTYGVGQGGR